MIIYKYQYVQYIHIRILLQEILIFDYCYKTLLYLLIYYNNINRNLNSIMYRVDIKIELSKKDNVIIHFSPILMDTKIY